MEDIVQDEQLLLTWQMPSWVRWVILVCALVLIAVAEGVVVFILGNRYWANMLTMIGIGGLAWLVAPYIMVALDRSTVTCTADGIDIVAGDCAVHAAWADVRSVRLVRLGVTRLEWAGSPGPAYFHLPKSIRCDLISLLREHSTARITGFD